MALPDETALRLLAKHKIEIAALPRVVPASGFAGKGSGLPCSLCEQLISAQEYELEYSSGDGEIPRFHIRCQQIWQRVLSEWCGPNRPR
ncbi:MAG TPA: hypothetical protein VFX20_09115 [Steroidobacteraceae bacterium]|nr:hypothetical protein [Steroidobacteraceae bacterium]